MLDNLMPFNIFFVVSVGDLSKIEASVYDDLVKRINDDNNTLMYKLPNNIESGGINTIIANFLPQVSNTALQVSTNEIRVQYSFSNSKFIEDSNNFFNVQNRQRIINDFNTLSQRVFRIIRETGLPMQWLGYKIFDIGYEENLDQGLQFISRLLKDETNEKLVSGNNTYWDISRTEEENYNNLNVFNIFSISNKADFPKTFYESINSGPFFKFEFDINTKPHQGIIPSDFNIDDFLGFWTTKRNSIIQNLNSICRQNG